MRALVWIIVAVAACKKGSAPPPGMEPPSTTEQDKLWALAPANARGGVVASPRALGMLEGGVPTLRSLLALPELAPLRRDLEAALGTATPTLAEYGMATDRGGALFLARDGMIAVLPVADRDKFLGRVRGDKGAEVDKVGELVCRSVKGVYACATSESLLGTLGQSGALKAKLGEARARGEIEVVGVELPLGGTELGALAAAIQLARGTFVIRGAVLGIAEPLLKRFASTATPRTSSERSAGFAIAHAAPLAESVPALPVGDTTLAAAMQTLKGPLTIDLPAGELALDARQALTDPAPIQSLLASCPGLAGFAGVTATFADGVCKISTAQQLELELWVEGSTLRIGRKTAPPPGPSIAMTALGKELAGAPWGAAFWGRGSVFGPWRMPIPEGSGAETAMMLRAFSLLNELGGAARVEGPAVRFVFGVRTLFANPDDVVAKVLAIDPTGIVDGRASELAKQIAAGAPQSPFATDVAAGPAGLMIPTALVGMVAAVAIPMFLDSKKKVKKSESLVQLDRIGKRAQEQLVASGSFPTGDTGLTPPVSCCEQNAQNKRKCDGADWSAPLWKALEFSLEKPHFFQYSYQSDGKTFTAKAVGDLDCDGTTVTYELRGEAVGGVARVTVTEPAPNSD